MRKLVTLLFMGGKSPLRAKMGARILIFIITACGMTAPAMAVEFLRLAVDFEQHCEGAAAPALFGSIRLNSDFPLPSPPTVPIEQLTFFHFNSEPGDFIGRGQELTLTSEDADITQSLDGNLVRFSIRNSSNSWFAFFEAPDGMDLTVGAYENANRWPFQAPENPGLSVFGNHRGCNTLVGRFNVHEIVIPPKITLLDDLNLGQCVEAAGPDGATAHFEGSFNSPNPVDFLWSTSTGDEGSGPEFSLEVGVDQSATVLMTAVDLGTSEEFETSSEVCVSDTTPPQVTIIAPADGETFVGKNAKLSVQVSDLVDKGIDHYEVSERSTVTAALEISTGESTIKLYEKIKGKEVELVELTVEAEDFSGNVGSSSISIFRAHDARIRN